MRALRAVIVIPGLFALTFKVIGNPQIALFATFGSFANLVFAAFGGTRRDKAIAHLGLAIAGSALIAIGTAVSGITWLAAVVTLPVAFAVSMVAAAGANGASAVTAALLAYVLPVASSGTAGMIPDRVAGWWLASAASTAAVLLLPTKPPGDRLRAAAAALAAVLAENIGAGVRGRLAEAGTGAPAAARDQLMNVFAATPYRPTGLATADVGLDTVVQMLEWCTSIVSDISDAHLDLQNAAPADRELLSMAAGLLEHVSSLLSGHDVSTDEIAGDVSRLERARAASVNGRLPEDTAGDEGSGRGDVAGATGRWRSGSAGDEESVAIAAAAQAMTIAAVSAVGDAMMASRREDPATVYAQRRRLIGMEPAGERPAGGRRARFPRALDVSTSHPSLRSVWFRNSARAAVALAAAVAVADVSGLEHAFWVVLGTLSVLRSNASSTGSTALRALAGTVLGFAVGAAVLIGIGTGQTALWVALPIAVMVAAYAPGTAPFAVGQAGFTIFLVVLFNLLAPAGWKVGLLRIEDVAIGCGVSVVVGILFWPRGAGSVVGDDLASAFRRGAAYLTEAVDWSLGVRRKAPGAVQAAVAAGIQLDDALRGWMAEQGTKRLTKQDLWRLVMATTRLRLTAFSVASLPEPDGTGPDGTNTAGTGSTADESGPADTAAAPLRRLTADLAGFYEGIAAEVGPPHRASAGQPVVVPALAEGRSAGPVSTASGADGAGPRRTRALWVSEYLRHLTVHAQEITLPAEHLAQQRRTPWWR
jgi:hypothetical protein